ncbi:MAG: hypothetical protein QNJ55_22505 [Xenococcus sp. MO_188.B8]|nr:hypothetical protein [Xenococcus sp. MO_188.B8]
MTDQNSRPNNSIRPEALQAELSIKSSTYYDDLSYLGIKADKDDNNKPYLTFEQAEQVRALRSYVIENGTRKGFVYEKIENESSIVQVENNSLEATEKSVETEITPTTEEDIYISETHPTEQVNLDNLFNNAQEIAARNIAMPHLLAVEIANNMSYEDLSPELQAKVNIARDAANPKKHQPKLIAQTLLKQLRSQRAS